ncbi:bifunctional folylpolyglutamate synthase/dihydrofolate synthase [Mucilaginibacter limnophilus]|uniref:Dihydrofolate synthase/folylpolyglutamate synthase n=1 Tax=Mucilaginibacter limnophilus TaxID=1932778 RepID=A0A437MQB7_9SPHI|nr:folylpolyglutamate synthase/dihydrofolate synthase family protein [Mucilaginibacter limnophilus]RVT99827.1 bifunctional folylpolyglutamate synthase/dihydrofolate synthase [Mucilaginibacter limnophilus]
MDYKTTLDYLYSQLPMFTRVGASAIKNNLDNTLALCDVLDNPQYKFKSVHIAGTNGKGSTSHMLASILQTAGYKTGLYTSPHLKDFRERIRINGQMISEETVIDFVAKHKEAFESIEPSFFEMTVALAFDDFAVEEVDIAIIEVGLGGRLDSTNVITPLLSVITNIGWDHMNMLGDTLPKIAVEKAGIIKPSIPVIISEKQHEVADVFIQKAEQVNAPITFAEDEWRVEESIDDSPLTIENSSPSSIGHGLWTKNLTATRLAPSTLLPIQADLTGTYQLKNIKGVLCAVDELRRQGFTITDEHIQTALRQVKALTGLHGRWEVLSQSPLTICDTGHNPDGIQEVLKNIASVEYSQLHFVIGMVNDKDITKVLSVLPTDAVYYFCKPDIPRGLEAESLKEQAESFGLKGKTYPSVKKALQAAQSAATSNDLVFAGGSTFVVAEIV